MTAWALLLPIVALGAAGDNPYLVEAKKLFERVQYERCIDRLAFASRSPLREDELPQVELYRGLCQFSLGRSAEARSHFATALTLDREVALPKYTSPKLRAFWTQIKSELPPLPPPVEESPPATTAGTGMERQPQQLVPRQVAEELPAAAKPDLMSLRKPPARRKTVPLILSGAAVAGAAAGTVLFLQAKGLERQANTEPFEARAIGLGDEAKQRVSFAYVGFGLAITSAATAALLYFWPNETD